LQSLQNEQSIVLDVDNLGPGGVQLIKRVYPGGLDLLNYSNMRMFVHGEGFDNRGDAELVMRFGNDLENNYYEYRQPVTPSDPNFPFQPFDPGNSGQLMDEAEEVWLYEENSMNIVLAAFNQLKQLRDQQSSADFSEVYERSDILEDAVPGAVVAIKGNPSLGRVSEVGMGIRNPFDPDDPSGNGRPILNAQFWLNELRVSGFDNEKGWAANAKSTLKLADFATVNANVTRQTQGFGAIDSRLGQRRVSNEFAYDINTSVNLDSFIPDRYGWNIPVNLSARRSTSVPKYLPNQGDIRFTDFEDAVRARSDLGESQQDFLIDQQKREIETFSESFAVNLSNVTKRNSESSVSRAILDNTTLNYNYNTTDSRNPQYRFQDNWSYNASLRYSLAIRNVRFLRPFRFLEDVPVANRLSGFQLGYTPNNITTSVSTRRSYEERKRRVLIGEEEQPLQQTHSFTYNTNFGFGYNLTRSITTSFQSQTVFDLARASIRDGNLAGIDSTAFDPTPSFDVYRDLLAGDISPRRNSYNENYTASWQPRINQIRHLEWLSYNARYSGGFRWENTPFGSDLGARVSNTFRLDHTLRMDANRLLNKISFYERAVEADRIESQERRNARNVQNANNGADEVGEEDDLYGFGDHLAYFSRKMALALFSFGSIDVNYNNSKTSAQAGYDGGSRLIDMFGGDTFTPSFRYRLGIEERIAQDRLISNIDGETTLQLPANNTYSDNITVSTRLNPFNNVSVDLNWQTQWDERFTESISLDPDNVISTVSSASGNISSSVWAFGDGYEVLFRKQLETAFRGMDDTENIIRDPDGEYHTLLNQVKLQQHFREAYLGSSRSIGERGFTALPLPNWRINWTGFENLIPFINEYIQRATLTHAYTGLHRTGWNLNNNPGDLFTRRVGIYTIEDIRTEYEPSSVNIERRFSPLAQMNITWENGLRTQIGYESSKITSLSLSNTQVIERVSKGLRVSMAYTIRNFSIPFSRRTASNVDLTINGNFIEDTEQRFLLDADLDRALQQDSQTIERDPSVYNFTPSPPTGQNRINGSAVVGYRFSTTVQANFEYAFSQILPKSSRTFKRTTHDIRFSIRINIRSM
jgi:cell surface protein SprA